MIVEKRTTDASRTGWIGIGIVAIIGLALRLWDLSARGFSHPENYASGFALPEWMPIITRKVDLSSLVYGTLNDGHPPLYYAAGLVWTKFLGTELWALRLPSVLFGTATILLVYAIGVRVASRQAALIASALLALHGHHIYFSQLARLYVFAGFFAALSTWWFLRARESGRTSDHVGYTIATVCALWSYLYCWPFVFAQVVWSFIGDAARRRSSWIRVSQATAILLSTPVIVLTLYQNPPTRWALSPAGYFGLGYALDNVAHFWSDPPSLPGDALWFRILVTLALIAAGMMLGPTRHRQDAAPETSVSLSLRSWTSLLLVGFSVAASIVYFAFWAAPRSTVSRQTILGLSVLPIAIAAALPFVLRLQPSALERRWLARMTRLETLPVWLAFLPLVCMVLVSMARQSFTARGTLIFLPFLLLAVALGVEALLRWRLIGRVAFATVFLLTAFSVRYFRSAESSPRDYAGLARQLQDVLARDDMIFVRPSYAYGPFLYYFPTAHGQFVGDHHFKAIEAGGYRSRIWLITWEDVTVSNEMMEFLGEYAPGPVLTAHNARAAAYLPPPPP